MPSGWKTGHFGKPYIRTACSTLLDPFRNPSQPGLLASFDASTDHTWTSVISSNGVTGAFDPSLFMVNTTGFQNAFSGTFSLIQDAGNPNNLDLIYVAIVPEPGTWALMLGSLASLLVVTKRRHSMLTAQEWRRDATAVLVDGIFRPLL